MTKWPAQKQTHRTTQKHEFRRNGYSEKTFFGVFRLVVEHKHVYAKAVYLYNCITLIIIPPRKMLK